jgi:DNA-binding CsgD family transcriptional regulator/N-acetylneuraminic acid mutarotase
MPELGEPLSERELDVLKALAQGATNQEIALELSISPNTVKVHLRRIYAKLGVSSRTEAVRAAMERGIQLLPDMTVVPQETAPVQIDGPSAPSVPPEEALPLAGPEPTLSTRSTRWRHATWLAGVIVVFLLALLIWQRFAPAAEPVSLPEPTRQFGLSRWFSSQPMPAATAGMAVAAIGLDVVLIGGETEAGIVNSAHLFDTTSGTWRELSPKPTAVADAGAAVLGGEIYVVGGRLADNQPTGVVEAYSPSNNAWRQAAPLPEPAAGALVLTDGSLLYAFGGWDGTAVMANALLYDPAGDSWRDLPPLPEPRAYAAGGAIRGSLYVVGGWDGASDLPTCVSFEPTSAAWERCAPMGQPHGSAGAAVLVNRLYVIGGNRDGALAPAELFDPSLGVWEALDVPVLAGRTDWAAPGVVAVESDIYLLGGKTDDGLSYATYRFAPLENKIYLPAAPGGSAP